MNTPIGKHVCLKELPSEPTGIIEYEDKKPVIEATVMKLGTGGLDENDKDIEFEFLVGDVVGVFVERVVPHEGFLYVDKDDIIYIRDLK